jgi:glucan phosphoethanolaminetransferase (alkaline phosphatase superfamily)
MPHEIEPFVLAVVVALTSAWLIAVRVILRVSEKWQRVWVWLVTLVVAIAAVGFVAMIVMDLVAPPRMITGMIQSLGDSAERKNVPAYRVVVNGTAYWVRQTDYQKLQVGERIRGQAGATFNFLQRIEVVQ